MDFSSTPTYLHAPNWHQPQQSGQIIGSGGTNPLLPPPHGSIRPGSMAERARVANVPIPEAAQKCPRCESTNTKFCYFNNYSLSQPRHFCKTCRRYWTRGGALRNVPVGGGCRRNKRSKSSSNPKSPASGDRQTNASSSTTTALGVNPQLRFMAPLSDNFAGDMGLTSPVEMNVGNLVDTWRLQPFPYLEGLETTAAPQGVYQFHGGESSTQVRPRIGDVPLMKMEGCHPQMNLSRQMIYGIHGNEQWNVNMPWNVVSSFSSSSTANHL